MKTKSCIVLILFFILVSGCINDEKAIPVDLSEKELNMNGNTDSGTIKVAIAAVISPEESFVYYDDLLDYISQRMNKPVTIVQRKTYQEINDLVRKNEVDIAFVCGRPYIEGHRDFGMELLAAPVVNGKMTYQSYIIVHKSSTIRSFEELRGKTFAFTDPISNSGRLYPTYLLAQMNETPDSFFKVTFYTYSHDKSIQAVNENLVEGAAVDSLVWEYENATDQSFVRNTRVINRSQTFGIPPVVVPSNLDPQLKDDLRFIFLNLHNDPKGREILDRLKIDRFQEIGDEEYQSIRDMQMYVGEFQ